MRLYLWKYDVALIIGLCSNRNLFILGLKTPILYSSENIGVIAIFDTTP